MLRKQFNESDLRGILTTTADDLFKSDDGTLGEAEQEILLKLQIARGQGTRIAVADLSGIFEKKPYGWPQTSTLCLLARLFMRGKVELRNGGNLLNSVEALEALSSNRNFGSTIVTLQEQIRCSGSHESQEAPPRLFQCGQSRDRGQGRCHRVSKETPDGSCRIGKARVSRLNSIPFLATLNPIASELNTLAEREWSHCLKNLNDFSEKLLDAKESAIDPLKSFYNGPKAKHLRRHLCVLAR